MKRNNRSIQLVVSLFMVLIPLLAAVPRAGFADTSTVSAEHSLAETNNAAPLDQVLNPDGTLNLSSGFTGNLDPEGFEMQTGPDGAPRFVRSDDASAYSDEESPDDEATFGPQPDVPGSYRWDDRFSARGIGGTAAERGFVYAIAISGSDVYVGGDFLAAGKVPANNVARWSGSAWHSLGSGTNNTVYALAYANGTLYAGGDFTQAGGATANKLARWDGSQWHPFYVHGLPSVVNGPVRAIAASGSDLYIGGDFTVAGGQTVNRIARWSGSQFLPLSDGVHGANNIPAYVNSIAVSGFDVYIGGQFSQAGGVSLRNVARWNGAAWVSLGAGIYNGTNYGVLAIAISSSGIVYAGGNFSEAGGVSASKIARYTPSSNTWAALGSGVDGGGSVNAITISGSSVYVGGYFATAGGNVVNNVAHYTRGAWNPLGSGGLFGLGVGTSSVVTALAVLPQSGPEIYVGGQFSCVGDDRIQASRIAKWSSENFWSSLGPGLGSDGLLSIEAITVYSTGSETYIVVGGSFSHIGGIRARNVARWNGTSWLTLGEGLNNGVAGPVQALVWGAGYDIYVGGYFLEAGNQPARSIARWSHGSNTWSALGVGIPGFVSALAFDISNGTLYAGGSFTTLGDGMVANHIARYNGTSWSTLTDDEGNTGVSGGGPGVGAIALSSDGSKVYVGGTFIQAGGNPANSIAVWFNTTQSWGVIGGPTGENVRVMALAISGYDLYVGGRFTSVTGTPANNIARYRTSTGVWYPLGSGTNGIVQSVVLNGSGIWVSGRFTQAGGVATGLVASWNSSTSEWGGLDGGLDDLEYSRASALAVVGSTLYVGGNFWKAGDKPSQNFARWYWTSLP